jgi:hypothetical protein
MRLIQAMAEGRHVCEHLHLPVQSGCDEILQRMNRQYSTSDYRQLIEKLRGSIPEISLTTDIIVGFPGETEAMFEETLKFVSEMKFDAAYTFIYSKRPGTPAATLQEQVPYSLKQGRLQRLMDLQNEISLQANQYWVDREVEVLADGAAGVELALVRLRVGGAVVRAEQPGVEVGQGGQRRIGRVGGELVDRGAAERELDPLDGLDTGGRERRVDDGDGRRDDLGADAVAEQDSEAVSALRAAGHGVRLSEGTGGRQ